MAEPQTSATGGGEVPIPNTITTTTNNTTPEDDDDDRSQSSAALRESFIRMTTQGASPTEDGAVVQLVEEEGATYQYIDNSTDNMNNQQGYFSNFQWNNYVPNVNPYAAMTPFRHAMTRNTTAGPPSLASAATTPASLTLFLPLACIVTHILFAYGQWAPMWRLSLTAEDIDLWANATSKTSQTAFDRLHLDHNFHYELVDNHTVQEFTYGFAVQELWEAKGMPGVVLPRIAALLLVIFSGLWPHIKLVLLQYSWTSKKLSQNPNQRTRTLGWLALLGKWSLADVLAVCVMVGVLNLEWIMDPKTMKEGILNNIHVIINLISEVWSDGDICTWSLKFDAHDCGSGDINFKQKTECFACKKFVNAAFYEPDTVEKVGKAIVKDVHVNGHGTVRLSVVGMEGIYAFCTAVILSVLLSAVVDWYNNKYIDSVRKAARERHGADTVDSLTLSTSTPDEMAMTSSPVGERDHMSEGSEPLLENNNAGNGDQPLYEPMEIMEDDVSVFDNLVERTTSAPAYAWLRCHHILPMVTLVFVGLAIYMPSMEREVGGAIPKYLKEILGINLNHKYSLATLQDMTGAAGGMDLLLMATFALFIVLGPLLRALLVVLVAMTAKTTATPRTQRIRSTLVKASTFLAAFCAWEVFLVAMVMVELLMPSVTNTILNTPACAILSGDGTSCLVVSYERVPSAFACLVLGWMLVGALAIHVSLEDSKERHMELHDGQVRGTSDTYRRLSSNDHGEGGLPPTEIHANNVHPTNPFGDAPGDDRSNQHYSNNNGGSSMIEEQMV